MSQFGVQYHGPSKRKSSGSGKLKIKNRDKKRHEVGGYFIATRLSQEAVEKRTSLKMLAMLICLSMVLTKRLR
jgi:hypothetical protein